MKPLEGRLILDFSQLLAGARGMMRLADIGAPRIGRHPEQIRKELPL